MNFTLIFDSSQQEEVSNKLLPLLGDLLQAQMPLEDFQVNSFGEDDCLMLYLSDQQIKDLLPDLANTGIVLAPLPHPKASSFCQLAGMPSNMEKAIAQLQDSPCIQDTDLLHCNDRPVFNSLVIGPAFQPAQNRTGGWQGLRTFWGRMANLKPFRIDIQWKDEQVLRSAVSGVVVVSNKSDSRFAPFIPGQSSYQDGMLHALLVCPRSLLELTNYVLRSLVRPNQLPDFGAYIKTQTLHLSAGEEELSYAEDQEHRQAPELRLEVRNKYIRLMTGALAPSSGAELNQKEVFKVSALPSGEAASELSKRLLPLLRRASTEEFKDLFQILRENARLKRSFIVLMVLSTSLATLGLFANSSPVIIGAMILAPLMAPIISLSMGALRQDKRLILDSSYAILAGIFLSFLFAVTITLITPIRIANAEILARTSPNLLDLGVAVLSGVAGAYGYAREEVAKTLAGVAIAVALVPPLAVAGIGLGWWSWGVFSGAALLLLTNLAGMVLAATVTFLLLGFSPFRLAGRALLISLSLVLVFSIPLALGFQRMMYEHRIIQSLDGWKVEQVTVKDVRVQGTNPLSLSVVFVSSTPLNDEAIDRIKSQIETRIEEEVELEIEMAVLR